MAYLSSITVGSGGNNSFVEHIESSMDNLTPYLQTDDENLFQAPDFHDQEGFIITHDEGGEIYNIDGFPTPTNTDPIVKVIHNNNTTAGSQVRLRNNRSEVVETQRILNPNTASNWNVEENATVIIWYDRDAILPGDLLPGRWKVLYTRN